MTSDGNAAEEPSPAVAAIVGAIRGRIVEYKELLLRQLTDQRVALLAIEDVAVEVPKRIQEADDAPVVAAAKTVAKEPEEPAERPREEVAEEEVQQKGETVVEVKLEEAPTEPTTEDVECDVATVNGHAEDESADRKRRASEVVEDEATPKPAEDVVKPEAPPPAQQSVAPIVHVVKRMRNAGAAIEQEPRGLQMLQRSSTPPNRYLEHRDDDEDEELRRLDESMPLVLKSPRHRARSSSSTSTTGRARAMTSIEDIHADFDQKLRVTMRLQRDVTRKSVAMTRKRQLPRLPTPARTKSHWDYLLEEMRWMAIDFSQERNWKRVMQFHLAKDVVVAQNAERVRREKENRQLARDIALQVSNFWRTIERIAARSHVRFEGGVAGSGGPGDDSDSGGANRGPSQESRTTEDFGDGTINQNSSPDGPTLRFKTIDVSSTFEADAVESTKKRIQQIVTASRRARSILQLTAEEAANQNTQRERVLQRLLQDRLTLSNAPTTIFTTFQIVALRWMLELSLSGCNVFLNDQLGMGMASTISAFLRALRYIEEEKPESTKLEVSRPHLIIASAEELHKWCHYVREWNPESGIVQVYGGSSSHRAKQRKEWTKKLTLQQFFSSEEVADLEKEDVTPVFACVCSAEDFDADRDAFESFENWDALIVESEHGGQFDDPEFVKNIAKIQHRGRRVLCCSQPLDAWSSQKTRSAYAELLLREPGVGEWPEEVWSKKIILDKASAGELVRWFGKSGSSLLKTQQEHLAALIVALHCLSLRRVRSEFESELGKLEETSVACALSNSQRTQYRNAAAGFVSASTSSSADRIELWLQFFLKLRSVCNCVDLLGDPEKLGLADLPFLFSSSAKLQNLHELLSRIVVKEHRRVVIYCQLDAMFPVVEMLLALMDLSFVQITGTREMQRRALCHYALRPAVQVALLSTRLGYLEGRQSIPVYGADAIVVLDSDWNSTCDAKMRAAWAKCIVGKAFDVPVYRFHCDETIEAALLRGGSCFSEKVFSEMSPQELVAEAAGGEFKVEKPSWWSVNGVYSVSPPAKLNEAMAAAETRERYCGTEIDGSTILRVVNVELDAQEHLLLANSDELTPVEWYAVNYLHSSSSEKKRGDGDLGVEDEWASATSVSMVNSRTTFDQLAALESRRQWQEVEEGSEMFFTADDVVTTAITDAEIQDVLRPLRAKGLDPHYDVMRPPEPPKGPEMIDSEPALSEGVHQQMFRVAYREPAPPAPAPSLILKLKADASVLQSLANDSSGKPLKKKRKDLAGRVIPGGGASGAAGVGASGIKRKHDQQLTNGAGNKPPKEPRLDFDGIPLPSDMTEFADDDFWGDTNLDALDSAAWDDPAVLSGILGGSLDSTSSTGTSIGAGSTSTGTTKKKVKSGGGSAGQATGGTGRARKGSISDSGKDGWNVQDDIVLKKLFELYGSNWTLIAHVFNTATSVSRFVFRKRTPRQCYDRYGKIISSGSLGAGSSSGNATPPVGTPTKDGKATSTSLKQQKLNAAAAAVWTPDVLAERVGIPTNETLLVFSARDSLPGLPPPSILNVPSLAELSLKKKKKKQLPTSDPAASSAASSASSPGGLDDLKSIRTSFDAIMQCMKRKTPPPPIPIPQPSTVITDPAAAVSTAGSMKYSIVTPVPTVVPPPHKSHLDLVELLPRVPLAPDDVIKRSKEAAAVAVQAAAAVASAGRGGTPDVSPLAAAGDSMMGSAAFNASAVAARKAAAQNAASLSAAAAARAGALSTNKLGTTASAWGDPSSAMRPPHASPPTSMHPGMVGQPTALGPTPTATPNGVPVTGAVRAPSAAMPVTTSALLHVLDRMPEIKNKIQAILNRSDCSEAQKVAMIARLLSNTNAINATAVAAAASGNLSAAVSATIAAASGENPSVPAATAQSLDTPIPMPASLANELSSAPTAIPMPASIAATVTPQTITSAAAAAASSAALASALADNDMADLA